MTRIHAAREPHALAQSVQRWRRSVVRAWIVTMLAALAAWTLGAAGPIGPVGETLLGAGLTVLTGYAWWNMRRGRCPQCEARIRFEPRIELPKNCAACGMSFSARSEKMDDGSAG